MIHMEAISISKDMTLADVMKKLPGAADVMTRHGLHCVGCSVNVFETLEQGTVGHGMDETALEAILHDLNELAKNAPAAEHAHHAIKEVIFTPNALSKVKELMERQGKPGYGLRVGVMPGGCAGFQYNMEFEKKPAGTDKVIEAGGVRIFMDEVSQEYMNGAVVDFVDTLQGSGFKIDNPNAKSSCGCGKSFG